MRVSISLNGKVPVYAGGRMVELCDHSRAAVLAAGKNAKVKRDRKNGAILRIYLQSAVDDGEPGGHGGNDAVLTYEETLAGHAVTVLKRHDAQTGRFVHWSERDHFSPRRFNPDLLPASVREFARAKKGSGQG